MYNARDREREEEHKQTPPPAGFGAQLPTQAPPWPRAGRQGLFQCLPNKGARQAYRAKYSASPTNIQNIQNMQNMNCGNLIYIN